MKSLLNALLSSMINDRPVHLNTNASVQADATIRTDAIIRTDATIRGSDEDTELNVLLTEYQLLRNEITDRIQGQRQLTNYTLLLIGAGLTAIASRQQSNAGDLQFIYLLIPIFFSTLMLTFLREDAHVYVLVIYTSVYLRERIEKVAQAPELVYWEQFIWKFRSDSGVRNRLFFSLLAGSRYLLPVMGAGASFFIYFRTSPSYTGTPDPVEIALFFIYGGITLFVLGQLVVLQLWVDWALNPITTEPAVKRTPFHT